MRRVHFAAAEIEAELEAARAAIGLLVDPYAPRSSSRPSVESSLSLLAEKVAERLAIERGSPEPLAQQITNLKTLGEVYDLCTADPRNTWCERTRIAYRTTRKWVMEFFGEDIGINEITREQARGFVQMLTQLQECVPLRTS